MTSIEKVFEQLEEQGIVFKSANNLLHISIDASAYIDIKRLSKEMHKQEIITSYAFGHNDGCRYMNNDKQEFEHGEGYYQETFVSKGSDDTLKDYHIVDTNEMVELPKQEISDEEIEKAAEEKYPYNELEVGGDFIGMLISAKKGAWFDAIKWYREQLKQL